MHKFNRAFQTENIFSAYPLYVLVISIGTFLLPFIYAESLFHKTSLPKFSFNAFISIIAFFTWLTPLLKQKKITHLYTNKLFFLLLVIFIFLSLSTIWSDFNGTYQLEIINFACLLLLTFTCMQIKKTEYIQLILVSSVAGGAFSTIIAFIQAWGWNPLNYGIPAFPASSFINKNHFANYIDLLIPTSFVLLIISKNIISKWINAIFISVLFSFIIFSHTRASWISLLVVLTLISYFAHKHSWLQNKFKAIKPSIILSIILLSLILINSPSPQLKESTRFENLYASFSETKTTIESSASLRLNAYKNALKIIKENPTLGTGLGSFYITFRPYSYNAAEKTFLKPNFLVLHNDPLQIIVELGLLGGFLCFSFAFLLLFKTYQTLNLTPVLNNNKNILYLGLFLAIISSILHSFLSFPLHLPASSLLLFVFTGLLLQVNATKINVNFKNNVFLLISSITIAFLATKFFISFIISSNYLNTAVLSIASYHPKNQYTLHTSPINKYDCLKAKKYTDKAMNTYSNDFFMHGQASFIYINCVKNADEHLKLTRIILNDNPYNKSALETAGLIAFNRKNFSLAKKYYSILSYLYPINSGYSLLLGHVASKQKEYKTAQKFYLNTLKLDPNNIVAKDMLEKLSTEGYL